MVRLANPSPTVTVRREVIEYLKVDEAKLKALQADEYARIRGILGEFGIPVGDMDCCRD